MTQQQAKATLDKIIGQIFGYQNPYGLEQFMQKYAFDVRLPVRVTDSVTGKPTWTQSANPAKFMSMETSHSPIFPENAFRRPKRELKTIEDMLAAWEDINLVTTERMIESINVSESDNIYNSENVYRSLDVHRSKNILFCDNVADTEYLVASTRSNASTYCIRLEDSIECSNSFSVAWSSKIVNCMFIEDCSDLYECMFCSHMNTAKFCIAGMQFEEAEYRQLKDLVVRWVLTG